MKQRPHLVLIYRCSMALMALALLGLAAGCAWLFIPAATAGAAISRSDDVPTDRFETGYLDARLLLNAGQFPEGIAKLEELRKQPDCPPKVFGTLTEGYLRQRSIDSAKATIQDGLKRYPDNPDLYLAQAKVQTADGKLDEALGSLEKALTLQPKSQIILEMMSEIRLMKVRQVKNQKELNAQIDELIKVYERMLAGRQGQDRVSPLLVLSSLYLNSNKFDRAVAAAQEAVRTRPREARCYLTLGTAQEKMGQSQEALKTYREVLLLDPGNDDAHGRIERLLDAQGKPGARREFYGGLARDFPDDKPFQVNYAKTLVADKVWKEAETQLQGIARRWPEEFQSRLELARVQVELKQFDEASSTVVRLSKEDKSVAPLANLTLAEALLARGEQARALKILETFDKSNPGTNENVTVALASLLLESKNTDRAIQILEELRKRHPETYMATVLLTQAYVQKKQYDQALTALNTLPDSVKKDKFSEIQEMQADLYRRQKNYDKAVELFKALQERDKNNAQTYMDLGLVYQEMGRNGDAETQYRKAIDVAPQDAETYNTLGYFYAETNQKLDQALDLVNKAIALKPGAGNIVDSLGWVLYRRGDFKGAVDKLKQAVALMEKTPDAVVYEHLGDACQKLGKLEEAREAWRKSLALNGESKTVKEKLEKYK